MRDAVHEAAQEMLKWNLGKRRKGMRKFRKNAGITLDELAAESGLSKSMLSRFENGSRDLSPEAFAKLMDAIMSLPAKRRAIARREEEAEKKLAANFAPKSVPLASLMGPATPTVFARYRESCRQMEQEYGPHWREVFRALLKAGRDTADLERRIAELRDLLKIETEAALVNSERDELREKIERKVPSDESED